MRLAQITDLHLNDGLSKKFRINAHENVSTILLEIKKLSVDYLVATGDFGDDDQHKWFIEQLEVLNVPFDIILGNHDSIEPARLSTLARRQTAEDRAYYYSFVEDSSQFIFLDTSCEDISEEQLSWLERQLNSRQETTLIFSHHPIVDCCYALDKYFGMKSRARIETLLTEAERETFIFCGHYHSKSDTVKGKIRQYVSPAAIMQIRGEGERIISDSFDCGFQLIEISGNSVFCSPITIKSERQLVGFG